MKRFTTLTSLALGATLLMTLVTACSGGAAPTPAPKTPEHSAPVQASPDAGKKVVGVTFQNLSNEWIAMEKDAMVAQAAKYPDIEFLFLDGEGDPNKQITQMDSFLSQKVDLILCNPQDSVQLTPSIKKAIEAGIPVIALGTDAAEELGQVWIGSANEDGGELQMQYLADQLGGKGDIAILRGPVGHYAEIGRYEGYERVLSKYPDLNVVFDQSADFSRELGMQTMENWLQSGKNIDAVIAQNDEMILGAAKAVEAANKQGEIKLFGLDGIPDALQAVKGGTLDATLYQDAVAVGTEVIEMSHRVLNGETIQRTNIPFELVTKDNVDDYIQQAG